MPTHFTAWILQSLAALPDADDSAWRCLWGDSVLRSLVHLPWHGWY
jgi:hypothetical protein